MNATKDKDRMNLNDLRTFVLVAELGTHAAAARRLGVPKSTVSRRVARLEDALGLALMKRSARSFVLTDDGQSLYERSANSLLELEAVVTGLSDSSQTPRGPLVVSLPIDLGNTPAFAALSSDFCARYPEVQLHVQIANRTVNLLEERVDIALRIHNGSLPDRDDLMVRKLKVLRLQFYAHPSILAASSPTSVDDLVHYRTIAHTTAFRSIWPHDPNVLVNDFSPAAQLASQGAGISLLPDFLAAHYVREGHLVQLPLVEDELESTLSLVWHRSRHVAPRVRAFLDVAKEHFRS